MKWVVFFKRLLNIQRPNSRGVLIRLFVMFLRRFDPLKIQLSGYNNAEKPEYGRPIHRH